MTTLSAWAQTSDVLTITGVTVQDATTLQAQSMIETFANRLYTDSDRLTTHDTEWLKRAVAWQAAWLIGQFGLTTRMSTTGVTQDGVTAQYSSPQAIDLAPMAMRALKNCSWLGTRSNRIQRRRADQAAFEFLQDIGGYGDAMLYPPNFVSEESDESHVWQDVATGY